MKNLPALLIIAGTLAISACTTNVDQRPARTTSVTTEETTVHHPMMGSSTTTTQVSPAY